MNVYILYVDGTMSGVYSSHDRADKAAARIEEANWHANHNYRIAKIEVDGESYEAPRST